MAKYDIVYKNLNIGGKISDIAVKDGKIAKIGKIAAKGTDMGGLEARAGLVDIHTHGMGGIDTMDGDLESLVHLYAKEGTTTVCPTTMTASREDVARILSLPFPEGGAKIAGFHAEGPYISENKAGAQNKEHIRKPDKEELSKFGSVSLVTVAPEVEGAIEYIESEAKNAVICVGHTGADYDTVCRAADAGANCVTHLYNTMPPLHHREPSVLGAAADKNMYVQVISDGIHIHPSVVRLTYKLFTSDRMVLISDSMRATRLPDGEYDLGGQLMKVENSVARTPDGALAGSTSTLFDCVKCAISFGIEPDEAYKMASETPAKLLGLNCGKIAVGYDCDLIVIDKDGNLSSVIIDGKII